MSIVEEFKQFAMKGNVMDLAVGVIIGGAFGKIVDSVVGDLIMPVIAWICRSIWSCRCCMSLILSEKVSGSTSTLTATC